MAHYTTENIWQRSILLLLYGIISNNRGFDEDEDDYHALATVIPYFRGKHTPPFPWFFFIVFMSCRARKSPRVSTSPNLIARRPKQKNKLSRSNLEHPGFELRNSSHHASSTAVSLTTKQNKNWVAQIVRGTPWVRTMKLLLPRLKHCS